LSVLNAVAYGKLLFWRQSVTIFPKPRPCWPVRPPERPVTFVERMTLIHVQRQVLASFGRVNR
jgi:hypothetical protein